MWSVKAAVLLCLLSIARAQTFIDPDLVIVIEGENATVTCSPRLDQAIPLLSSSPPGSNIFSPLDTTQFEDNGEDNRTFIVSGLVRSDNGSRFQCSISGTPSPPALLLVYYAPSITIESSTDVAEGNDITIRLSVDAFPEPIADEYVVERMGGRPIPAVNVTDGTVTFSAVMRSHAGTYVLTLSNEAGSGNVTFELGVLFPPEYDLGGDQNPRELTPLCGASFQFSCSYGISSVPDPLYSASASGVSGAWSISYEDGTITIDDVTSDHGGIYTCNANNSQGTLQGDALKYEINIESGNRPQTVLNLNYVGIPTEVSTDLTLTWKYEADPCGIPVTSFIVSVSMTDSGVDLCENSQCVVNPEEEEGQTVTYTVPEFEFVEKTSYTVSVTSYSSLGESDLATIEFMTAGAVFASASLLSALLMIVVAVLLQ